MSIGKICNDGPSYRVGEAPRATPFGLARLPNIDPSVMYQKSIAGTRLNLWPILEHIINLAEFSQCICIHVVNMKTALRLCSYSIPDAEILKTIISIPLNRGSDI